MNSVSWLRPLKRSWAATLDVLFPPQCDFCSLELEATGEHGQLCVGCRSQLTKVAERVCQRCGCPVPQVSSPDGRCAHCRKLELRFLRVAPYGWYRDELKQAVKRMKHSSHESLTVTIAKFAANRWASQLADFQADLVTCVPSHWSRRFQRGTHAPENLAREASRSLRAPVLPRLMACRRKVNKQSMLSFADRALNVQGAFRVTKGYDIRDARIVLVDDVLTTGATANEATKELLVAGAAGVAVAVVARALPL